MLTKQTESAGGVILNKRGQVLVVNQKGRAWSLPKGHIEKGETPLRTAKREIEEESGLTQLTFIKELGSYSRYKLDRDNSDDHSEMKHITLYLFSTAQEELAPKDPHNPEAKWVDQNRVAQLLTHQKDKEFFLSILKELK